MADRSKKRNYNKDRLKRVEQYFNFYSIILRIFEENKEDYLYKNKIYDLIINKKSKLGTGLENEDGFMEFLTYRLENISSKENCFDAIEFLFNCGLLEIFEGGKDDRKHKFVLSDDGRKISRFLKETADYQKNYFKLEQSVRAKIPHKSRKEWKELKLYNSGWKDKDIEFYHVCRSNALDLIDLIENNFTRIVLFRYSKIMDESSLLENKNAKIIFNDVIIKVFENKIRFILEKYKTYEESAKARWVENYTNPINQIPQFEEKYESGLYGQLPFYRDIVNFFNYKIAPQMIEKDITKMILSYLKLLEFPKERIATDDINFFLKNKKELMKEYVIQNRQRDTANIKIEYDYEHLIKLRFDTQELFQAILIEYIK
ncbi:hypothetical protein [Candidatus Nitrosocosmicus arcticus]|uniref:hypothetical protein n=1 Tax=Candidatus Nitrosocosmicus arcticus TaxID=2035267 RepID=UPI0011A145C2|nr:hypothetical protein [Candidatus Nitrosocosmicus arcticus]